MVCAMLAMLSSPHNAYQGRDVQKYLLGIDLGAGSLKATIIDDTGRIMGEAAHPVTTSIPRSGWSEQSPPEWFASLCAAVPAALTAAAIPASAITAWHPRDRASWRAAAVSPDKRHAANPVPEPWRADDRP